MEQRILVDIKKNVGLEEDDHSFDHEILTHINSAFSTLYQIGIGSQGMFVIEDETTLWSEYNLPTDQLAMVKALIAKKVRLAFDPPATSFHIDAIKKTIEEDEVRLSIMREEALHGSAN